MAIWRKELKAGKSVGSAALWWLNRSLAISPEAAAGWGGACASRTLCDWRRSLPAGLGLRWFGFGSVKIPNPQ